jgi:hypothetical protein
MWIVNGQAHLKFTIPHYEEVFFLVSYWLVFTLLVSYWLAFTFFLTNTDSEKYAEISHYYPHHEGARGSPMRIHDVEGKSVVNYPHHECAKFIANRFHEENSRALPTSLMWNVKFRMCLAIYYPHS